MVGYKWREMIRLAPLYRQVPAFLKSDLALMRLYVLRNPYREAFGTVPFGSTPISEIERMARAFRWKGRFLELGSGLGRAGFWLEKSRKMHVRGVDLSPSFIRCSQKVAGDNPNIEFIEGDLLESDFSWPDVVYFYSTAFSDEMIKELTKKLSRLKEGAQVVTISAPLNSPDFYLFKRLMLTFPWGKTFAYCHKRAPAV